MGKLKSAIQINLGEASIQIAYSEGIYEEDLTAMFEALLKNRFSTFNLDFNINVYRVGEIREVVPNV